jgi:hypothetical protein
LKVFGPKIEPWMKQADKLPRVGIKASNVRPFETITVEAREGEIIDRCRPSVLSGDDVVDLKRQPVLGVRYSAVLAPILCPFPDLPKQKVVH